MQNPNPNLTQSSADFSCLRSAQQTSTGLKAQSYAEPLLLCLSYYFPKAFQVTGIYFPNYFMGCWVFSPAVSQFLLPIVFLHSSSCTRLLYSLLLCTHQHPSAPPPAVLKLTSNVTQHKKLELPRQNLLQHVSGIAAKDPSGQQVRKKKNKKKTPSVIKCLHIRLTKKSH